MKIIALNTRSQWASGLTTKLVMGTLVMGTLVMGTALGAQAQDMPGGGGPGQGGGRPNFQNMTPEQRQQMQAQMEERRNTQRQEWLRQAMTASGLTDAVMQNAVINHMTAQEKTRVSLQEQARALSAMITNADTLDEKVLQTQLVAYRAAVAAANAKSTTDLAALDAQVKYSTNVRMETLLTLLGVIGNETTQLGGIGAIFPDSPYSNQGGGRGRGGRGQGGRRGGQGGGGQGGGA